MIFNHIKISIYKCKYFIFYYETGSRAICSDFLPKRGLKTSFLTPRALNIHRTYPKLGLHCLEFESGSDKHQKDNFKAY